MSVVIARVPWPVVLLTLAFTGMAFGLGAFASREETARARATAATGVVESAEPVYYTNELRYFETKVRYEQNGSLHTGVFISGNRRYKAAEPVALLIDGTGPEVTAYDAMAPRSVVPIGPIAKGLGIVILGMGLVATVLATAVRAERLRWRDRYTAIVLAILGLGCIPPGIMAFGEREEFLAAHTSAEATIVEFVKDRGMELVVVEWGQGPTPERYLTVHTRTIEPAWQLGSKVTVEYDARVRDAVWVRGYRPAGAEGTGLTPPVWVTFPCIAVLLFLMAAFWWRSDRVR